MAAQMQASAPGKASAASASAGANLVALAGIGLIGYGIMFLVRNFTGFIEPGLTPAHIGGTPEQIMAYSPDLFEYISHLQVAISGLIIALGVAVVALAWFGIRNGERWAMWTALVTPLIAMAIGVPLHFPYGLGTLGHLGLIYLDVLLLLVGTGLSYRALRAGSL